MLRPRRVSPERRRPNAGSPRESRMSRVRPTRNSAPSAINPWRLRVAQHVEPVRERALQHQRVDAVRHQPKSLGRVVARPVVVGGEERRRLAVRAHAATMRSTAARYVGCLNCAGIPRKLRQIEMAEPQRIDARDGGDRLDVVQPFGGLDLRDHHRALRAARPFWRSTSPHLVVVMREAERGAAASKRRITRAGHDMPRLFGGAHHRHHHAKRANVQRAGDERVFAARHAHHRHDAEAAAQARIGSSASRSPIPCAPCRTARIRRPRCGRSAAVPARRIRRPSRRTPIRPRRACA